MANERAQHLLCPLLKPKATEAPFTSRSLRGDGSLNYSVWVVPSGSITAVPVSGHHYANADQAIAAANFYAGSHKGRVHEIQVRELTGTGGEVFYARGNLDGE